MLALEQRKNMLLGRPAEIVWLDEPNPARRAAECRASRRRAQGRRHGRRRAVFVRACDIVGRQEKPVLRRRQRRDRGAHGRLLQQVYLPPAAAGRRAHQRARALLHGRRRKKWYILTAAYVARTSRNPSPTTTRPMAAPSSAPTKHPCGTSDFSSIILKIRAAKPDVVIGGVAASDLTTFLKQWNELGMRGKIPFAEIAVGNTDLWGVGPEAADGLFTLTWYYKPEQSELRQGLHRRLHQEAQPSAGRQGVDGLVWHEGAAGFDRGRQIDRTGQDRRGAGELEPAARQNQDGLPQVRPSDDVEPAGRVDQAEDHRQVGLLRRQGRTSQRRRRNRRRHSAPPPRAPAKWTVSSPRAAAAGHSSAKRDRTPG